jgi:hypothetical protein
MHDGIQLNNDTHEFISIDRASQESHNQIQNSPVRLGLGAGLVKAKGLLVDCPIVWGSLPAPVSTALVRAMTCRGTCWRQTLSQFSEAAPPVTVSTISVSNSERCAHWQRASLGQGCISRWGIVEAAPFSREERNF